MKEIDWNLKNSSHESRLGLTTQVQLTFCKISSFSSSFAQSVEKELSGDDREAPITSLELKGFKVELDMDDITLKAAKQFRKLKTSKVEPCWINITLKDVNVVFPFTFGYNAITKAKLG